MAAQTDVLIALKLRDQASAPMRQSMSQISRSADTAQRSTARLSESVGAVYGRLAALAGLIGAGAIARGFIETAAAMEKTRLMLTGLEGSSEKAKQSMDWILDFAGKAPYDLNALSDTFVKLRTAGLDPTAGSMQALVDAVAAFGGSNELLHRASVAIQQMGGKGVISMEELRQQLGEAVPDAIQVMASEMHMTVRDLTDMVSRGALDSTTGLTALFEGWSKKHQGAAETFAGSMSGLWNQLKLQYELFKNDLMTSGDAFINLKAALKTTLDLVKAWREDKSMADWADKTVGYFGIVIEGAYWVGKAFAGWHIIWEGVKLAWDATTAAIWKSVSWLVDKMGSLLEVLADIQEFLDFDSKAASTREAAAGMREWADQLSRASDLLVNDMATKGVQGLEDAVSAAANLGDKFKALKQTFADNVQAMKDHASAAQSTASATAAAAESAGSAVAQASEKASKEVGKLAEKLDKSYESLRDFLAVHSLADDAARKIAALNIEYGNMADQLSELQDAGYDVVEMSEQLETWYSNSMDAIQEKNETTMDNVHDKVETTADEIHDTWTHMYERLQDITADWIYNMKIDFDSIVDLFKRSVAEMVSAWIWGQGNMQSMISGQGGGGLSGFLSNLFGGGVPQPGDANFIGPLQQASSLFSLSKAYGAYGAAGGGWAGLKAGAGSFFNLGGAGAGGLAGIGIAYLSALNSGGNWLGGQLFDMEGYNTHPEWAGYGGMLGAGLLGGLLGPGLLGGLLGPVGGFLGGSFLGGLFGSNKKRSYLDREYTFSDYSAQSGWGDPDMEQLRSKRKGEKMFGEAADSMIDTAVGLMNSLDSVFKNLLGSFGDTYSSQFTTQSAMLAQGAPSFEFNISAEDEDEFTDDFRRSWEEFTKNLIDPIVESGTALLREALDATVTDNVAWNYFTDEMKEYLTSSLEDSLADLQVDWSEITDQESFEAALEQIGLAAEEIEAVARHFAAVSEILESITDSIELREFSDVAQSAIMALRDINARFDEYAETLKAAGVDLEKFTDLEEARLYAIQDSIEAMMQAGMSSEDLTAAIQRMADEMTAAGHTLEEVTAAVTAAWLAAADAASTHIADSYAAAMEQIRTSMMSDQELYNYYSSQVAQLKQSLSQAEDPAELQRIMDDILRYTMLAYGMLTPEQQQIYGPQFLQSLQDNQKAADDWLKNYRDQFKSNEQRLLDLIGKLVSSLMSVAGIQRVAADTQMAAANLQLGASQTPLNVGINLSSSEVG
jgi:tape measure domain-containing protein